jgi:hypothetical protein
VVTLAIFAETEKFFAQLEIRSARGGQWRHIA